MILSLKNWQLKHSLRQADTVRGLMKRIFAFTIALCVLFPFLFACDDGAGEKDSDSGSGVLSDSVTEGLTIISESKTEYVLVYPAKADDVTLAVKDTLVKMFKFYYDIELVAETDKTNADAPAAKEILLGNTSRAETSAIGELKYNDWVVKAVGEKLVIAASRSENLAAAVESFGIQTMKNLVSSDKKRTVTLARDYALEDMNEYPLEGMTVGGVDIGEFIIIQSRSATERAESLAKGIQDAIGSACGVYLEIANDRAPEAEHEIVVGETTRALSVKYYADYPLATEYGFYAEDGHILFLFGGDPAATPLLNRFKKALKNAMNTFDVNTLHAVRVADEIDEAVTARYEGTTLRLMTSNVLHTSAAAPDERVKLLDLLYHAYLPDFLCLQEMTPSGNYTSYFKGLTWYAYLPDRLSDEYAVLDAIPEGGKSIIDNANPILYRKDRFEVLEKKCFSTQEFDDDEITYGIFKDLTNNKIYIVFSIHWLVNTRAESASVADGYRLASAKIILDTIESLKAKYNTEHAFVLGDFNAVESTASYKHITSDASPLSDAKYVAEVYANTTLNTGHTLGQMPTQVSKGARNYDFILVDTDSTRVMTHTIISNEYALNASDHCPVYVDVILK